MAARTKSYTARAAGAAAEDQDPRVTRRRIASVVAAAGGWYTTWLFITAVGIDGIPGFAVSVIIEWLLFEFKREVLAPGSRLTVGGIAALAGDTILNGAGMWSVVLGLNNTNVYEMFEASMRHAGKTTAAAASAGFMPMLPYLVIALVLGFILAIAPHKLWNRG